MIAIQDSEASSGSAVQRISILFEGCVSRRVSHKLCSAQARYSHKVSISTGPGPQHVSGYKVSVKLCVEEVAAANSQSHCIHTIHSVRTELKSTYSITTGENTS